MLQFYTCLTVDHDWRLVVLAGGVCVLASAVAVSLFHRAQASEGRARLIWLSLDAAAAGSGIWATHFIAILAYDPAIGAGYNLKITVLSLLLAILITGAGLGLALLDLGRWKSSLGGAVVGAGIGAMHYTGMVALDLPGQISWSVPLLLTSIAFGILFGAFAIFYAAIHDDWINSSIAVSLFALGILLTHFTGMAAVQFTLDPTHIVDGDSFSPTQFSPFIAAVTTMILGMCLVAALSDRKSKGSLRKQKLLLDAALDNMAQGLAMFDAEGRVTLCNDRYVYLTGLPAEPIVGRSLLDLLAQRKTLGSFVGDHEAHFAKIVSEMRQRHPSSRTVEVCERTLRVIESPMEGGGWIATFEDITDWLASQQKITHMAHHDALTDLANRTQLVNKLDDALTALPASGENIALMFIDLDRFKSVNDSLGHDAGDFLLKTVAERLRAVTRPGDLVARLGGDEFVVVQTAIKDKSHAERFARRIAEAIAVAVPYKDQKIQTSLSMGVALAPADGMNPERLLKCADLALYKAKDDGRNCVRFFEPEFDAEMLQRARLEGLIRDAMLHDGFELHYQPLFEMSERRLIGFEALIRLRAEDGSLIAPLEFIPLAEELWMIGKIGTWVLQEACRAATAWPGHLSVAVNLSPAQFALGSVSETVAAALKSGGLAPDRLELEITEALLLGDSTTIMTELAKIKAMGVRIVMDDFGTGHSSLSYLWKFPFDKIKIDRSFMQNLNGTDRDPETVVKTIIALGKELKMRVTVEGVETEAQAAFLDAAKGDQVQGFFFGRPVPASEIAAKILTNFQQGVPLSALPTPAAPHGGRRGMQR